MDENVSHFRFHHSREEQDAASNLALLSNAAGRPQDEPPPVVQGTEQEDIQEGQFPWGEECSTIRWKKRDRPSSKMVAPPPPSPHPNHNHNHNHRQEEGMDPTPIAKKAKTLEMTVHHSLDDPGKCPSLAPAPFFFYRDHSQTPDEDPLTPLTPPGRVPNFPAKMHAILSRPDLADVVAWLSHGRSWRVLKPREFEIRVIPIYFEHSKFSSFIRQANGWGFRRITQGRDRNSYYNELFLRGLPHLCKTMRRPGVNQKPSADPEHEPEFAKISERFPLPANVSDDESIMLECTVKGGPKARMPVSFRGASASSVRQSSTRLSKATTEPPRHPPSHPAPSYPTSLLSLSNAPTPIHPPPNPSHSVMLSSLQMSLQAAQDQMLQQQHQQQQQQQQHHHQLHLNSQTHHPLPHRPTPPPPLPNPYLKDLLNAQAQVHAQVSHPQTHPNLPPMAHSSANAAANHLQSAASHFRSALSHALALSHTPEFLAAVATTTSRSNTGTPSMNQGTASSMFPVPNTSAKGPSVE